MIEEIRLNDDSYFRIKQPIDKSYYLAYIENSKGRSNRILEVEYEITNIQPILRIKMNIKFSILEDAKKVLSINKQSTLNQKSRLIHMVASLLVMKLRRVLKKIMSRKFL